jgi:hypothetical protein
MPSHPDVPDLQKPLKPPGGFAHPDTFARGSKRTGGYWHIVDGQQQVAHGARLRREESNTTQPHSLSSVHRLVSVTLRDAKTGIKDRYEPGM